MKTSLSLNPLGQLVTTLKSKSGLTKLSWFQNDFGGFDVYYTDTRNDLTLHDSHLTLQQLQNLLLDFQTFGKLDQLK